MDNLIDDLQRTAEQQERDKEVNNLLNLKKQVQTLTAENKSLREKLGSKQEFIETLAGAVSALEPLPPYKYSPAKRKGTPVVPVITFSDWQIGELIDEDETEGYSKFNFEIAEKRVFSIVEDFLKWVEMHRGIYPIDRVAVFQLQDMVSGDIHDELRITNEFTLPEQASRSGMLLGESIARIAPHFSQVDVYAIDADNHGRLQKKPQAKLKGRNNMGFLVNEIASLSLRKHKHVHYNRTSGTKMLVEVNGKRFLLEHGDNIKSQMGIPYYGFQRMVGREAKRRMNTDKGFDYYCIGHFHVPAIIENTTIVNGCLTGTTEFDHGLGRHAEPAQVAYFVHPEHGIFNYTAFKPKD